MNSNKKITDLAVELCEEITHSDDGLTFDVQEFEGGKKYLTHIKTAKSAKKIGKPIGIYCNIELNKSHDILKQEIAQSLTKVFATALLKFIEDTKVSPDKILVVGLGNSRFVADSLGPMVCENITPTDNLATFTPSIQAVTGIESTHAIKAIVDMVKPSHVVIIDSLCCHEKSRLGTSFQISNSGITPGSGVYRNNQKLGTDFLGVPVIAIGVPLVIYLPSLHYVVPKTIDILVGACAGVIGDAVGSITFENP